ncbi:MULTISPECIES: hypothetical protein [unclassified Tolypothrix]|uniref:hypothetical protein n=1 Tax=unclassified Tolypothrix TaxID=2649714 RepID=UPI0005EABC10|nr:MULTISPECIES: hypothetical protein [unclassified Tolypothrix]EKF05972.1 hypothetical protein FDUTEX481_00323 [Tolypothrix sp. PCC 7601]MBE9084227.1 hypothetical protein [Tolypothrix sp. LEGE 11397]UYD31364.1 hypothetical protein HG267_19685 [Tolypothrix sp. PCC 7601]BAY92441.1 hypothetical protein NIES3275_44760 [Microchaete diplosiphon NIES-3275]
MSDRQIYRKFTVVSFVRRAKQHIICVIIFVHYYKCRSAISHRQVFFAANVHENLHLQIADEFGLRFHTIFCHRY